MDLERVDRITAGAIGEPGHRTFFLQARSGGETVTVLVEKQQVQLLAASVDELLGQIDVETADGPGDEELELEPPLEPLWRAGRLSIGYHQDLDLMLLEIEELVEDVDDGEERDVAVPATEPQRLRLWATREQMRAVARHGAAVVAAGRPLCQFCGNPIDAEGHACPAMNGHGSPST